MEMSPKAIAAVTFPVVRKGYDPEQVRSFLSQLSRGVEELQNRALQAEAKARLTSAPAAESANVESITKTLLLAQRTADSTLAEARQEAEGIRRQASERAEAILAEAKAQGAQLISAAEQEASRSGDAARARVTAEVEALEARRQALLEHSEALSGHVVAQRERLAATVEVLQRALEQPDGLQELPRPEGSQAAAAPSFGQPVDPWGPTTGPPGAAGASAPDTGPPRSRTVLDQPAGGFPAPSAASVDPITQEVPTVGEREPQAWSFWEEGPTGDDRWKR